MNDISVPKKKIRVPPPKAVTAEPGDSDGDKEAVALGSGKTKAERKIPTYVWIILELLEASPRKHWSTRWRRVLVK